MSTGENDQKWTRYFLLFFPTRPSDEYDSAPSRKYSRPLLDFFVCIGWFLYVLGRNKGWQSFFFCSGILPFSVFDPLTNWDFVKNLFWWGYRVSILKIESQTLVSSSIFVLLKVKKFEMIFLMLIPEFDHAKLVRIIFFDRLLFFRLIVMIFMRQLAWNNIFMKRSICHLWKNIGLPCSHAIINSYMNFLINILGRNTRNRTQNGDFSRNTNFTSPLKTRFTVTIICLKNFGEILWRKDSFLSFTDHTPMMSR